jgi:hypothetical protein
MTPAAKMRTNAALAVLAGLALRVFFVLKFPATNSGDAPFYIDLAWNWLKRGVYGFEVNGRLTPVDMRVPGYPAFLASIFAFAGKSPLAIGLSQAVVDVATCILVALIASKLAPGVNRRRATLAALWLAVLCPFTANYCAVPLTETLITFLTALAILVLLDFQAGAAQDEISVPSAAKWQFSPLFLGGIVVGFGTLVRPEAPLLLLAAGLVLLGKWWRPADWSRVLRAGVLMSAGLLLPLLPWAARNWYTLHDAQFLAPRHSELAGEFVPTGFIGWTNTWLWRLRDVYLVTWKADTEEISINDLPASAFDSPEERARVEALLARYNDSLTVEPDLDAQFREITRERTARQPLRTYLRIPLLRSFTMWFSPRVELLPFGGHLWPLRDEWRDDRRDFVLTLSFVLINGIYVALAFGGAWVSRSRPGCAFLILFILIRTLFFAYFVETPEPRYVLECFPAVIALAAQVFSVRPQLSSTGSG